MASLGSVLPQYGEFRFDRTLEAARHDIGDEPDLANPAHAVRLRKWLNQWICRIGYPKAGEADVFAGSLASWWIDVKDMLPAEHQRLAQLADAQLQAVGHAYAELYRRSGTELAHWVTDTTVETCAGHPRDPATLAYGDDIGRVVVLSLRESHPGTDTTTLVHRTDPD